MKLMLALLALIVPATATLAAEAAYRCADGTSVRAAFSPPGPEGSVRLTYARHRPPVMLPQVLSADGGRYANRDTEFWIKGRTARLTRGASATQCKQVGQVPARGTMGIAVEP